MEKNFLGATRQRFGRRRLLTRSGLVAATGVLVIAVAASAATLSAHSLSAGDVTSMTVSGLAGEGSNGHTGWIEISSWSWGASNPHTVGSGGLSAGKVTFNPFSITRSVDKASPKLFLACATGNTIPSVTFVVEPQSTGVPGGDFLTITLTNVKVSGYSLSSGGDRPSESVSMNYTKISMTYSPQGAASVQAGWDLAQNKKA